MPATGNRARPANGLCAGDGDGWYHGVVGEVPSGPLKERSERRARMESRSSSSFSKSWVSSLKSPACRADLGLWISDGELSSSLEMISCLSRPFSSSTDGSSGEIAGWARSGVGDLGSSLCDFRKASSCTDIARQRQPTETFTIPPRVLRSLQAHNEGRQQPPFSI